MGHTIDKLHNGPVSFEGPSTSFGSLIIDPANSSKSFSNIGGPSGRADRKEEPHMAPSRSRRFLQLFPSSVAHSVDFGAKGKKAISKAFPSRR